MGSKLVQNSLLLVAGIFAALAFLSFYWQSDKDAVFSKVLAKVNQDDLCPDANSAEINSVADTKADIGSGSGGEDKIYFVGCGGFF